MRYLFFDERVESAEENRRVLIAAVLVDQGRFKAAITRASLQGRRSRRLETICRLLERSAGYGLLGHALLSPSQYQPGLRDSSRDIPDMARTSNIWSHLAGQTAFALITSALAKGEHFRTVDAYHDPYDLKLQHQNAWNSAMRRSLGSFVNKAVHLTGLNRGDVIRIRHVRAVAKNATGDDAVYSRGIQLAHEIGAASEVILQGSPCPRIEARDLSTAIETVLTAHYEHDLQED